MKATLLFLIVFISNSYAFSQCTINPFIEENYTFDAKILALRDIVANPNDPNYDNPFLPDEAVNSYLERLSALYENPNNDPEVDRLFNFFRFHVNVEYNVEVPFKHLRIGVHNAAPWIENFRETGVSGVPELDMLMSTFGFSIDSFTVLPTVGITLVHMKSSAEFLNITALYNDFLPIEFIIDANGYTEEPGRFNYTGENYTLNGELTELSDILISGNVFRFMLGAGDCFASCSFQENRFATVTEDCEVLSKPSFSNFDVQIYPNPTSEVLNIEGLTSEKYIISIYSIQGKLIRTIENSQHEIEVSALNSGMYFIEILNDSRDKMVERFIKM